MKATRRVLALILSAVVFGSAANMFAVADICDITYDEGVCYVKSNSFEEANAAHSLPFALEANRFGNTTLVSHYYNQLDAGHQVVYNVLKTITPTSETITIPLASPLTYQSADLELTASEQDEFSRCILAVTQPAIDALLKDYPSIFWLKFDNGTTFSYHASGRKTGGGYIRSVKELTFHPVVEETFASTAQADYAALNTVVKNCMITGSTRYQKLKFLHDFLANTVTYRDNTAHAHDAYGALVEGSAVCEGYAEAFKLLCDRENIPCILAVGSGMTSNGFVPHMWNLVQMEDENWYAVDVTWDDQKSIIYYDYFLSGSMTADTDFYSLIFSDSHVADGICSEGGKAFSYPALSQSVYVPSASDEKTKPTVTTETVEPTTTTTVKTTAASAKTTTTREVETVTKTNASAEISTAKASRTSTAVSSDTAASPSRTAGNTTAEQTSAVHTTRSVTEAEDSSCGDNNTVTIVSAAAAEQHIPENQKTGKYVLMIIIPVLLVAAGGVVWFTKRKK